MGGKILVFYDSRTDCTKQMAELVAEGARSIPSNEVRIRSVDDCVADDVLWADGLAVGTPTNLGGVSWKMKRWWDEEFAPKMDGISETLSLDLCDPALSMDKENFHILPKAQQKLKVLIYTRALDYIHSSTPAAASFLYSYCIQQDWDVTVSDENELMETPNAPEWDVIILLNNSGAIFDPKSQILTKHIEDGKGVLGVHAALACFLNGKDAEGLTLMEATCPIIEDTFGAHFKNHPLPQKGTVKVNQEITKDFKGLESLPDEFIHEDEFFNFSKNPCDNKNIVPLLFADESTYEGGLMGEKHPLVWYQYLGDKKAPIFYCAIGHFSHFYNNTRRGPKHVQTILKAGLQFVAKNK